jgi:DNA-binding transcriptional regulator YiaG
MRLKRYLRSTRMPAPRKLRLLRRALWMSGTEFAQAFGIPEQTVNAWETGRAKPRREHISYLMVIAEMPEQVCRLHRGYRKRLSAEEADS